MAASSISDFPRYSDGDVLVLVGPRQRYQLHASVLRRNSVYFERLLTPNKAAQLSSRAQKDGVTILYLLELARQLSGGLGGIGSFHLRVNGHSKPVPLFCHI